MIRRGLKHLFSRKPIEPTAIGIRPPDGTFDAPLSSQWKVLDSDVAARMYRNDIQLFFNFGAGGAVRGIKGSMARFAEPVARPGRRSRDQRLGMAANVILQPIQQEILNLMALAVQSNFEKSFRRWLRNSVEFSEGHSVKDSDVIRAAWLNPSVPKRDLGAIMEQVRGVHLQETVEGPLILELALVGNVIRHGDGPSARTAWKRYPDVFDPVPQLRDGPALEEHEELPERLRVTEERLALYAQAAFQFWHRVQYAYTGEY